MEKETDLNDQKKKISLLLSKEVVFDDDEISLELKNRENSLSLPIKVLIILGALLSGLFFMAFLMVAGFLDSEFGLLFISLLTLILGFALEFQFPDKITPNAFNLTFYLIGFSTLGAALSFFDWNDNVIIISLILLSIVVLAFSRNHITTFSATIGFNVLIFIFIVVNEWFELFNLHLIFLLFFTYLIFYKENLWIKMPRRLLKMYLPLRSGIIISLIGALSTLGFNNLAELNLNFLWLSSFALLFFIGLIFYNTSIFDSNSKGLQTTIALIICLPLILAPAVLGGILITLLSFRFNYKTGLTLGILCFLYFIGQFYYDLELTLFTKSILLMATGLLFLVIQYILHKNKLFDEIA